MKKLLLIVFSISFLNACSSDKDFLITKDNGKMLDLKPIYFIKGNTAILEKPISSSFKLVACIGDLKFFKNFSEG